MFSACHRYSHILPQPVFGRDGRSLSGLHGVVHLLLHVLVNLLQLSSINTYRERVSSFMEAAQIKALSTPSDHITHPHSSPHSPLVSSSFFTRSMGSRSWRMVLISSRLRYVEPGSDMECPWYLFRRKGGPG